MEYKNSIDTIEKTAHRMRRHVVEMGFAAGGRGAHFGPAMSSIEIIAALFLGIMNHDPKDPGMPERDRFVQSKGHACLSYYAALGECGYISEEEMATFKADDSFLSGHPSRNMKHGIEISSGSLGNGFAIACGMAKAAKIRGEQHHVFCLVGDGECNEGIIWEAAMNGAKNKLDNLVAIVDRNRVQLAGKTEDIMDADLVSLWKAAGWEVLVVQEGNDVRSMLDALDAMRGSGTGQPHVIIAETTKGRGISFMEGSLNWHARPMDKEHYDKAMADLDAADPVGPASQGGA